VGVRLHLGCGDKRLEGWINIDGQALPGVDVVADLRRPLDFDNVEAVFAEHFIEHLRIEDTLRLFAELHRVLRPGGVVRLSTPNLDWVWSYCYHLEERPGGGRTQAALVLNRAFHAWGHQFLWNEPILRAALTASGFVDLRACRYGQSDVPFLRGLERHETYPDSEEMPH